MMAMGSMLCVQVGLAIGVQMMVAVMGGPPERALLGGGLREEGEPELPEPVELVGAMTEVPVVPARHAEHPQVVRAGKPEHVLQFEVDRQNQKCGEVQANEGQHRAEVVVLALHRQFSHSHNLLEIGARPLDRTEVPTASQFSIKGPRTGRRISRK